MDFEEYEDLLDEDFFYSADVVAERLRRRVYEYNRRIHVYNPAEGIVLIGSDKPGSWRRGEFVCVDFQDDRNVIVRHEDSQATTIQRESGERTALLERRFPPKDDEFFAPTAHGVRKLLAFLGIDVPMGWHHADDLENRRASENELIADELLKAMRRDNPQVRVSYDGQVLRIGHDPEGSWRAGQSISINFGGENKVAICQLDRARPLHHLGLEDWHAIWTEIVEWPNREFGPPEATGIWQALNSLEISLPRQWFHFDNTQNECVDEPACGEHLEDRLVNAIRSQHPNIDVFTDDRIVWIGSDDPGSWRQGQFIEIDLQSENLIYISHEDHPTCMRRPDGLLYDALGDCHLTESIEWPNDEEFGPLQAAEIRRILLALDISLPTEHWW